MRKFYAYILPFVIAPLFLASLAWSAHLDAEKERENEAINQRILAEEEAKRKAWEAEEKIYLLGKFEPEDRKDFVSVSPEISLSGYQMYLRKETLEAFEKMREGALKDKIDLKLASGTRNFNYQKEIWEKKWTGITLVGGKDLSISIPDGLERFKKILEYSAVPGTSRHHWGTDIDINEATVEYFETVKGKKVYEWLLVNAPSFGFCQPYTAKDEKRPIGHNEERWHWSYLPLARTFTNEYLTLIKDDDLVGEFLGSEFVFEQDLISEYFSAISPDCL